MSFAGLPRSSIYRYACDCRGEQTLAQVSVEQAVAYLARYREMYRDEYDRYTARPPNGPGYPEWPISPFLDDLDIRCWLADDGAVVAILKDQDDGAWSIAGGPAMFSDYEPTVQDLAVQRKRDDMGLPVGTSIGHYRIVLKGEVPQAVWQGELPAGVESGASTNPDVTVDRVDGAADAVLARLTFGVFSDEGVSLGTPKVDGFWQPWLIRDMGFFPADRSDHRFVRHVELLPHLDQAAWDLRSIDVRVSADVRADFALFAQSAAERIAGAPNISGPKGGAIARRGFSPGLIPTIAGGGSGVLGAVERAIRDLREALREEADSKEAVFHALVEKHADVFLGPAKRVVSKPRFRYPEGSKSKTNKQYVEPDFVIEHPAGQYEMVELERPNLGVVTKGGRPRSEVTHAAYQISEWFDFLANYPAEVRPDFPGMTTLNTRGTVVIGDGSPTDAGRAALTAYSSSIITYADLVERAEATLRALRRLVSLDD